jgi:hypothetical protein
MAVGLLESRLCDKAVVAGMDATPHRLAWRVPRSTASGHGNSMPFRWLTTGRGNNLLARVRGTTSGHTHRTPPHPPAGSPPGDTHALKCPSPGVWGSQLGAGDRRDETCLICMCRACHHFLRYECAISAKPTACPASLRVAGCWLLAAELTIMSTPLLSSRNDSQTQRQSAVLFHSSTVPLFHHCFWRAPPFC